MNEPVSLDRYVIAAIPAKNSQEALLNAFNTITVPASIPGGGFHLTLFGFYTAIPKYDLIDRFVNLPLAISIRQPTRKLAHYDKNHLVIEMDNVSQLRAAHKEVLGTFKTCISFKDGGTFNSAKEKFEIRYPYTGEHYNPHISIARCESLFPLNHFSSMIPKEVYFHTIALYRKENKERIVLAEKHLFE